MRMRTTHLTLLAVLALTIAPAIATPARAQQPPSFLAGPFDFSTMEISPAEFSFAAFFVDRAYDNEPWSPLDETLLMRGGPERTLVDTELKVGRLKDSGGRAVYVGPPRGW